MGAASCLELRGSARAEHHAALYRSIATDEASVLELSRNDSRNIVIGISPCHRRARLLRLEFGNRFAYLDAEQAVLESQHDLTIQQNRAGEITAARAALMRQRDQTRAEYSHKVLSDLSDAEQKVGELTEDLLKARRKLAETELRAPIDGIVQQLAIHTIDGVVTPAEQLMVIVPEHQKIGRSSHGVQSGCRLRSCWRECSDQDRDF